MSVSWKDETSEARLKAHAAAHESGEFDCEVKEWSDYCDLREALIWALLITGFPPKSGWGITEQNWQQVYGRLHILERVNDAYRIFNPANGEDEVRRVYFTAEEVHSMIGMTVNAGNKSDAEFKKYIWSKLQEAPSNDIERFDADQ